jgi:hypothetical protein
MNKEVLKELLDFMDCIEEYKKYQIEEVIYELDRWLRKQFRQRICEEYKLNKWRPMK